MKSVTTRLEKLENHIGNELIIIAEIDGVPHEMSAKEYGKTDIAVFKRVKSGSRLGDLDKILDKMLGWAKI